MMYENFLGWSKAQFMNRERQGFGKGLEKELILRMNKSINNTKVSTVPTKLTQPKAEV